MADFLLFQLYGPLAAWGDVAVGERRPAYARPSKSAVLGLVAGALGLRRDDEVGLGALHAGYRFACRVDAAGSLLTDYHTVQVRKGGPFGSRREELSVPRNDLHTILSSRDYRCDAYAVACISPYGPTPRWSLRALADALRRPVFAPYLGRKACAVGLPFDPRVVPADSPVEALRRAPFDDDLVAALRRAAVRTYCWEGEAGDGTAVQTVTRRDQPGSRSRWQFADRQEHLMTEGEPRVSQQD